MNEFVKIISNQQKTKKRKRKTSDDQYEIYLSEMEGDYVFRSGSINPTLDENYLNNKWIMLAEKLNATGNGPQLPVEEWKRRFKDWKNSTRAKYRKMQISRNSTGGGPESNTKLTPLEDRGLSVWGKVTVTGFEDVEEGGLPTNPFEFKEIPITAEVNPIELITIEDEVLVVTPEPLEDKDNSVDNIDKVIKTSETKTRPRRAAPLNEVANNILAAFEKSVKPNEEIAASINKLAETYKAVEAEKLKLESKRLNFEIEKFKFENPTFNFNSS